MAGLVLEINDAGMCAARTGTDELLAVDGEACASVGVARVASGVILTGAAARRQETVDPRGLLDRFWDRLDTEPADPRDPRGPNRAEVACAHLQQVLGQVGAGDDEIVFAVPPSYDERQLGMIVAMARDLNVQLRGIVASPIAIALDGPDANPDDTTVLVIDLHLHRAVLSLVEVGTRVTLRSTRACPDAGLLAFRRQWVRAIGNEFVRRTRFDPLHDAAAEHCLQECLPPLLDALARGESEPLELPSATGAHEVTVTAEMLGHAGHALMVQLGREVQAALEAGPASALVLTHEAGRVPGLRNVLERQVALPLTVLGPGAVALGLARAWPEGFEQTEAPAVAWHTERAHVATPSAGAG